MVIYVGETNRNNIKVNKKWQIIFINDLDFVLNTQYDSFMFYKSILFIV